MCFGGNLCWIKKLVIDCALGDQRIWRRMQSYPHPNPLPEGEGACLRLDGGCGLARFCLDPLPSCRVELNGSGAPSGMTAQPQLVQGCTICGVPLDPESEARKPAAGGRLGGGGLSFGDFSLATQRKVTRPGPKGGRNPVEDGVLASCVAKPRHQGHPQDWEFGLTPPGSRTSEYATLFEPTASHHIDNLRGTLTPLTLALSQGERGQRRRERQQAGKRKGAGQAPFDALIG